MRPSARWLDSRGEGRLHHRRGLTGGRGGGTTIREGDEVREVSAWSVAPRDGALSRSSAWWGVPRQEDHDTAAGEEGEG